MSFGEQSQSLLGPQALALATSMDEIYFGDAVIDQVYATTLAVPALTKRNTVINVAALTGNTIVPAPTGLRKGMAVTYNFTQDGTGGRTITWNAVHAASANAVTTASYVGSTTFVYDGARLVQVGGALTFKA